LEYKNKVCGICGNYNGEAKDDIATKRGLQIKDMQRFFKSWKVSFNFLLYSFFKKSNEASLQYIFDMLF